ncbi:hypothetical protein BDZ91DRAFT_731080 [Kalaharituber pfeilii]|nr:hypothetical protein BDZ91DRAFT_731080 [Kalaharituber pfeilii]
MTTELAFFPSLLSFFTNHLAATIFPIHGFAFSVQSLTFPSFFVTAIPCTMIARPDCGSVLSFRIGFADGAGDGFLDIFCLGGLVLCPSFTFLGWKAVDTEILSISSCADAAVFHWCCGWPARLVHAGSGILVLKVEQPRPDIMGKTGDMDKSSLVDKERGVRSGAGRRAGGKEKVVGRVCQGA